MFKMLNNFFSMLAGAFSAGNRLTNSADNMCAVAELKSELYLAEQTHENNIKRMALEERLNARIIKGQLLPNAAGAAPSVVKPTPASRVTAPVKRGRKPAAKK